MSTKKLTLLAMFATISLAIYAAESAIPPLVPLPGVKLGLANVVTLILLRHFSLRDAAIVLSARIGLSALLFGQALSLLYSLAGGLAHNMAQLITALAVTSTPGVLAYLPFLTLSGVLTGAFTGFCAQAAGRYLMPHLPPKT